jgi:hypothetical protein
MITLQERIESFATTSSALLLQLTELSLLRERVKQAQSAALKSIKGKSNPRRSYGDIIPPRKSRS